MASGPLEPRSALARVLRPGRFGASDGQPGVTISQRSGVAVAHIAARRGAGADVAARSAPLTDVLIGLAPGEWLALAEGARAAGLASALSAELAGLAGVVDLSSAKAIIRVSGPRARDVLAKGCPLDLDARAFAPGDAATTLVAQIGCTIRQVDAVPTYDLLVPRSFAESFYAWLAASAAAYGYEVTE